MKIVGLSTKQGKHFAVGFSPEHLGPEIVVESIIYNRPCNVYNKGFQTSEPGYAITIVDSPVRRLVPEREVSEVLIDVTPIKKKGDEVTPAMENFLTETE